MCTTFKHLRWQDKALLSWIGESFSHIAATAERMLRNRNILSSIMYRGRMRGAVEQGMWVSWDGKKSTIKFIPK